MSKRPLLPLSNSAKTRSCLDFDAWNIQQVDIESDEHYVYDPSSESMPDNGWYALDIDMLCATIEHMCDDLGRPITSCKIHDPEIADLLRTLDYAKSIPSPKKLNIAVVGHQGIGRSSIINALLDRDLIDVSASSSACTAFATIIEYKDGAIDHTDLSDLKVTFLELNEIRDFIEEHIRRYADVYSPRKFVDNEEMSEEEDDASAGKILDDDVSEEELSDGSECQVVGKKRKKKVSKAVQQGADNAEEFFRILFNTSAEVGGAEAELELQNWLKEPDLEDGRFLDHCADLAMAHLEQVEAEEDGSIEYVDVMDVDLQKMRDYAARMWPLVKAVTISTGSVLLRNGICIMDLPGHGDLNQTRTAVVNEYRSLANFEIVVAKSDRYLSKTDEDRYLTRAIRHHGASNVFLVLNKADSCLEVPRSQIMRMLKTETEEPFASIRKQFFNSGKLTGADRRVAQDYRRYLIKEAQMADGQRECNKIKRKMQKKGVQVFPVAAARYLEWLDILRLDVPSYMPDDTGIPLLRQALLSLPAEANYQDLSNHVFETLSDIQDKVSRILTKFTDDEDITSIRQYLIGYIPQLGSQLRTLSITVPYDIVPRAWDHTERSIITNGMENHIKSYPQVPCQTFWLLLRENGIATHGKYRGKNLNHELLQTYKSTIRRWKIIAMPKAKELANRLDEPIQATLMALQQSVNEASGDPNLKQRADQALAKLTHRISLAQGRLQSRLEGSVGENYLHFTTEDDLKCPIAQELKSAYARIENMRRDERRRKGIYLQQRTKLIRATNMNNYGQPALVDAIPSQVKARQCEKWQAIEEDFITDVLARFEDFARIMEELLENETYMSDAHKQVRKGLSKQFPYFNKALAAVRGHFPDSGVQRATKKARKAKVKHEVDLVSSFG